MIRLSREELDWLERLKGKKSTDRSQKDRIRRLWLARECYRLREPNLHHDVLVQRALFYATQAHDLKSLHNQYRRELIDVLKRFIIAEDKSEEPRRDRFHLEYLLGEMLRQDRQFDEAREVFKSVLSAAVEVNQDVPEDEPDFDTLIRFAEEQDERCIAPYRLTRAEALEGFRIAYTRFLSESKELVQPDSGTKLLEAFTKSDDPDVNFDAVMELAGKVPWLIDRQNMEWKESEKKFETWWSDQEQDHSMEILPRSYTSGSDSISTSALHWLAAIDLKAGVTLEKIVPDDVEIGRLASCLGLDSERLVELNPLLKGKTTEVKGTTVKTVKLPILEPEATSDPVGNDDDDPFAGLGDSVAEVPKLGEQFVDLNSSAFDPFSERSFLFGYNELGVVDQLSNLALAENKAAQKYLRLWLKTAGPSVISKDKLRFIGEKWPVSLVRFLAGEKEHCELPAALEIFSTCAKYLDGDQVAGKSLKTQFEKLTKSNLDPYRAIIILRVFQANSDPSLNPTLLAKLADNECPTEWFILIFETNDADLNQQIPQLWKIAESINSRIPEKVPYTYSEERQRFLAYSNWIEYQITEAKIANQARYVLSDAAPEPK